MLTKDHINWIKMHYDGKKRWKLEGFDKNLPFLNFVTTQYWWSLSVTDAARLTGWAKPGEIWQFNIWIWIFQPHFTSFYAIWIFCVWLIPISRVCTTSKLFRYRYLKVFNQVGNRQYFQLVEKKKWFAWQHAKN